MCSSPSLFLAENSLRHLLNVQLNFGKLILKQISVVDLFKFAIIIPLFSVACLIRLLIVEISESGYM